MPEQKVPFLILKGHFSKSLSLRLRGFSSKIKRIIPGLDDALKKSNLNLHPDDYVGLSLVNSFFFLIIFSVFLFFLISFTSYPSFSSLVNSKDGMTAAAVTTFYSDFYSPSLDLSALFSIFKYSLLVFILILVIFFAYPKILAKKKAENIDRNLVFALKDISLQVRANVPLYNALISVSHGNYGEVSSELAIAARDINSGKSMGQALEEAALRTQSEFMHKVSLQLINTIKAGANLKVALQVVIDDLMENQKRKIKNYAHELNVWTLVYLLFAVAIPSIGSTLFIILSSFAGIGLTEGLFIFFLLICLFIQVALIGLIKSRRPIVYAWK